MPLTPAERFSYIKIPKTALSIIINTLLAGPSLAKYVSTK
jgi:hypothetical protein